MKSFAITLSALAAMVVAQNTADLPECGQICATNMLSGNKAEELGCAANDLSCLCQDQDFIYGFRDCSAATCGSDDARRIVEFGLSVCRDAGVLITTASDGEPTITGTDGGDSNALSTISSGGSAISTVTGGSTPSSGSADTTVTETATETGTPSASGSSSSGSLSGSLSSSAADLSSSITSGASGLISTITSEGSTFVTTFSTAPDSSETGDESTETGDESTATDGAATSTDPDGAAMPQRTLAPAGIIVAGLAAFLL
jgi:hypothetical protein